MAPVIISNETEAVLKVCISANEYNNEINALKLYGGSAMCKLIDSDPERGVLLLEKLEPGNSLVSIVEELNR